ncbi:AAA family ATPase [Microbispora bryophytorum]|uniref:AAA family ATPase n=1 Tax=Microbispora bryophytorum TaxID=1460882 RepID=UPI0033F33AE5
MTLDRKQLDLEDERTAQKRYRRKVQDRASRPITHQGPRSNFWTGTGLPQKSAMPFGDLVGRVALRQPHELLDGNSDFYIGETRADVDGIQVYSWAAPVACTFFRGHRHHELCDEVAVIRAFEHRGDDIIDFYDEPVCDDVPAQPFHKRVLSVPAAPSHSKMLRPPAAPAPTPSSTPPVPHPRNSLLADTAAASAPSLRAEALLRARLAAPRAKSLAPVLATLQPDQYDLVTVPAMDSMIIEGQPGTGKTIVASHRAAYLVSDETPPENTLDGTVLIVGPTRGYSRHVRTVIARLTGESERVRVLSLPELMRRILGAPVESQSTVSRSWQDVDKDLAMFVRAAITRLKASDIRPTSHNVYEHLRGNGSSGYPVTRNPEWIAYLRNLPPVQDARNMRAHIPLLATIKWEVAKPGDLVGIEHIIVDEAQDVTPLEWLLLASMNEAHAWTLIGDLNQRRSDHTLASWAQVLELLAIPHGDPPVRRLVRGYRSTRPILRYANRLLPAAERAVLAFQEVGPEPTVEKCRQPDLGVTVLRHVTRLQAAHPHGTVAVITADPKPVETVLRREGWVKPRSDLSTWRRAGREVTVAQPDDARGLEFDGVVVAEPADFPQNFGRQGPLYTALTRPNRELAVVHAKPLPERLRKK